MSTNKQVPPPPPPPPPRRVRDDVIPHHTTPKCETLPNIDAPDLYYKYNDFLAYLTKNNAAKRNKKKLTEVRSRSVCHKLGGYIPNANITNKEFTQEYSSGPDMFLDKELLSELFKKIRDVSISQPLQNSKDIHELASKAKSILDSQSIPSNNRWAILPISLDEKNIYAIDDLGFKIFRIPPISESKQSFQVSFGSKNAIELIIEIEDRMLVGFDVKNYSNELAIAVKSLLRIPRPESIITSDTLR